MKNLIYALLFASFNAQAWCGYIGLSGSYNNVPGNGGSVPLSMTQTYSFGTWSWNTTLPADTTLYVTDIIFQSKNVQPDQNGKTKSSYLVINSFITVAEHMGGQIHFNSPMIVPPGTTLTGAFINQSTENQNMVAILTGYAWDSQACKDKFRP